MNEQLVEAIVSAGQELQKQFGWGVRDDGEEGTIDAQSAKLFVDVLHSHIAPLLGNGYKRARIAALKAELAALEGKSDE